MTTTSNRTFTVPTREEVSESNQGIFDNLKKGLGFVPNLYAYFAKSETALGDYLALQNRKSSLKAKEREVINLVVSQINGCCYCQSAHTVLGKMNGFTDEQIIELRQGSASFDSKLDALAKFTASVTETRGHASIDAKEAFFAAGYTEANLIDAVIIIGDKIISNYIHNGCNSNCRIVELSGRFSENISDEFEFMASKSHPKFDHFIATLIRPTLPTSFHPNL